MSEGAIKLRSRTHGEAGPDVIALHGGPAAVGEAEPMARGLSGKFSVYEPFQRGSGDVPLTVAVHIEDLHQFILGVTLESKPSLVGESWGAMLALAYTSIYTDSISALALVVCGTFDVESRRKMEETIDSRLDETVKRRLLSLAHEYPDLTMRIRAHHRLIEPVYSYDPIPASDQFDLNEPFDSRAYAETWNDMMKLQEEEYFPAAFSKIKVPVLMIHGDYDPHPGEMIYAKLKAYIPQLEYYKLTNCGHFPWQERRARKQFFMILSNWLLQNIERP
jgi:pimeloyl-ACP methyl ester carboxylesterase